MKHFKKILSAFMVLAIFASFNSFAKINANAIDEKDEIQAEEILAENTGITYETAFHLDITAPEKAVAGDVFDVVITVKNITKELLGVGFKLKFDNTKVSGVITKVGESMDAFMTTCPTYIMTAGSSEIKTNSFEQICKYDEAKGFYNCVFVDLLDYPYAKAGQTFVGLKNDGDLVITIPFKVKDNFADNDSVTFSFEEVMGTTRDGLANVVGTSSTATTSGPKEDSYEIVFKNDDGTILSSELYNMGDTVVAPDAPTKPADKLYSYEFAGWDKEIAEVTQSEVYTAVYTRKCACFGADEDFYLDVENGLMGNLTEKTTASTIKAAFAQKNISVTITDANGAELNDSANVGTGCVVTDEMGYSYTVILLGDVDGNGIVNSTDYLRIKAMFINEFTIEGIYAIAADVDFNDKITSTDYLRIKSHFIGETNLYE